MYVVPLRFCSRYSTVSDKLPFYKCVCIPGGTLGRGSSSPPASPKRFFLPSPRNNTTTKVTDNTIAKHAVVPSKSSEATGPYSQTTNAAQSKSAATVVNSSPKTTNKRSPVASETSNKSATTAAVGSPKVSRIELSELVKKPSMRTPVAQTSPQKRNSKAQAVTRRTHY